MTIYQKLLASGAEIDNRASDLYVKSTPETRGIVAKYEHRGMVTEFRSGGSVWLDIPFAFDPYWHSRGGGSPLKS